MHAQFPFQSLKVSSLRVRIFTLSLLHTIHICIEDLQFFYVAFFVVTKCQRLLCPSGDALPSWKLGKLGQWPSVMLLVMNCIWKTAHNSPNSLFILAFIILIWKWLGLVKHRGCSPCIQDEVGAGRTSLVLLSAVLPCYWTPKEGPLIVRNGK